MKASPRSTAVEAAGGNLSQSENTALDDALHVPGRVDLHTHVLPAVDDGARNAAESLAMLRIAVADGTRVIVATPHGAVCDRVCVQRAVHQLRELARSADLPVRLLGGSEQRLTSDLPDRLRAGEVATLADTPWLLVELSLQAGWPSWFEQAIYALQMAGGWPILAHAERYPAVQRAPLQLASATGAGVLMQINAGSLLGQSGARAQRAAEQLLRLRLAHLIASDAHAPDHRPPRLAAAFERATQLCGPAYAAEIAANAERVVAGVSVTPSEPWLDEAAGQTGLRRWWAAWARRRAG
jgi:protein-tyrosine phosphatase